MRAIIPCAGYGTRVKMKKNESKEMKSFLGSNGKLIDNTLRICKENQLDPLVITRKEKKDLIKHCDKNNVEVLIIKPNGEWPNTILASVHKWEINNILLLPDTILSPESAIQEIKMKLELENTVVFGVHAVLDISKWGSLWNGTLTEKPNYTLPGWAWGIIGFNYYVGKGLFKGMIHQGLSQRLHSVGYVRLDSFQDLTR